jgi:hypothetical protein
MKAGRERERRRQEEKGRKKECGGERNEEYFSNI